MPNGSNGSLCTVPVPDDTTLNAMGAGELTILGMQCRLEGGQMKGEVATREALRRYRDEGVHRWKDGVGSALSIPVGKGI